MTACLATGACSDRAAETGGSSSEPAPPPTRGLQVGDAAPDFALPGSDGHTYRLADYKGRQAVVLAWFTKAFTAP